MFYCDLLCSVTHIYHCLNLFHPGNWKIIYITTVWIHTFSPKADLFLCLLQLPCIGNSYESSEWGVTDSEEESNLFVFGLYVKLVVYHHKSCSQNILELYWHWIPFFANYQIMHSQQTWPLQTFDSLVTNFMSFCCTVLRNPSSSGFCQWVHNSVVLYGKIF